MAWSRLSGAVTPEELAQIIGDYDGLIIRRHA